MADAVELILGSILENWQLFVIIILGVFTVVPWASLIILNFFNGNIVSEILATFNRRKVKIVKHFQNGQCEAMYKDMLPDRKILMKANKDGLDETVTVTNPPSPDRKSHRQTYFIIEGQEGTKDLLRDSKYDVNTPQKRMAFSMYFELGREFEKAYSTRDSEFNYMQLAGVAIPTILLIGLGILVFSQMGTIDEMAALIEAMAASMGVGV